MKQTKPSQLLKSKTFEKNADKILPERKLQQEELGQDANSLVDVRAIIHEKEKDNPLSDLWDTNHMRVTKQNVSMDMNMPLNRLKLQLDGYKVRVIVHNEEDFQKLYDYFNPEEKKKEIEDESK